MPGSGRGSLYSIDGNWNICYLWKVPSEVSGFNGQLKYVDSCLLSKTFDTILSGTDELLSKSGAIATTIDETQEDEEEMTT